MEVDKDHIHYMIETTPNINLSNLVRTMKSDITYHIWKKYSNYLSKCFWKERTFFSDGYFISSIGNVSRNTSKNYI
jgi:putative transposase